MTFPVSFGKVTLLGLGFHFVVPRNAVRKELKDHTSGVHEKEQELRERDNAMTHAKVHALRCTLFGGVHTVLG